MSNSEHSLKDCSTEKEELEELIRDQIRKFENRYGVAVLQVDLLRRQEMGIENGIVYRVILDVQL